MIDYMSFSIDQLQAVDEVLDYITDMLDTDLEAAIVYREYSIANKALHLAIAQQARDHAAAEAEKVDRIVQACIAGAPPAEEPAELRDLQSLVDDLYRCSARLAALADGEDEHFAECSRTEVFDKVMLLRGGGRAVGELAATIRDHYDGLH